MTEWPIDFTERWIVTDPAWIYTADLTPILNEYAQGVSTNKVLLVFYGLDTVATIVRQLTICAFLRG